MAEPMSASAGLAAVTSWIGANAGAIAASAAGAAGAAGTAKLLKSGGPTKKKPAEQAVPDSRAKTIENERRMLRAYANQGSVASAFGKDKLG